MLPYEDHGSYANAEYHSASTTERQGMVCTIISPLSGYDPVTLTVL